MGFTAQQRLVFVLTVNIGEHFAEQLQLLHGAGLTIDVAARTTLSGIQSTQNTLPISLIKVIFLQPLVSGINFADIKGGSNFGAGFCRVE